MIANNDYYNILKYKFLSYYTEALLIAEGSIPYPRLATFHTNYICNYQCGDCKCSNSNTSYRKNITYSSALKIINQLLKLNIKSIDFSGGGEPLLTPGIEKLLVFLKKKSIQIGLITNGYFLRGSLLNTAVASASYIRIGLDASTPETYSKIKNTDKNNFSLVCSNIETALRTRTQTVHGPEITLKFTLNDLNVSELESMIFLSEKLGVDAVFVKPYENSVSPLKNAEKYEKKLQFLKKKYHDKLPIIGSLLNGCSPKAYCHFNPLQITVDMLGDIYICSYYEERKNSHKLGNIFSQDIKKIWFGKEHRYKIKNINMDICSKYSCKLHSANYYLSNLITNSYNKLAFI